MTPEQQRQLRDRYRAMQSRWTGGPPLPSGSDAPGARELLEGQAGAAGGFADRGESGFGALGAEGDALRKMLMQYADGSQSLSREQLRQGLMQNVGNQRAMAASASPQNAAMAARNAAMNANRAGSAMSGQAAIAGIQERQAAQNALAQLLMAQRDQDLRAALGGRGLAIQGYGNSMANPEKSWFDTLLGGVMGGAQTVNLLRNPAPGQSGSNSG